MYFVDLVPALLAGMLALLALAWLLQWRSQGRARRLLQRDLARIFEQLDLMAQVQQEQQVQPLAVTPRGAGVTAAEARILTAMRIKSSTMATHA